MAESIPPPLPAVKTPRRSSLLFRAIMAVGIVGTIGLAVLIGLRTAGVIRSFSVPTNGMAPAVSAGDQIMMRGLITPRRGDVIIFNTASIEALGSYSGIYVQRLAGLPGETVRIAEGKLYINGQHTPLRNKAGEIEYQNSRMAPYLRTADESVTVPEDCYFTLGDNSRNSADGRYWGFVPKRSVLGRAAYCYYPPSRSGAVE